LANRAHGDDPEREGFDPKRPLIPCGFPCGKVSDVDTYGRGQHIK
jgi:hypothetical protein